MDDTDFLTLDETAELLQLHPDSLRRVLRSRNWPDSQVNKVEGRWRIHRSALGSLRGRNLPPVRRPNIFDEKVFRDSYDRQGCRSDFVGPLLSDVKLIDPLLWIVLGPQRIYDLVKDQAEGLGLGNVEDFWPLAIKYHVGAMTELIEDFKRRKGVDGPDSDENH